MKICDPLDLDSIVEETSKNQQLQHLRLNIADIWNFKNSKQIY